MNGNESRGLLARARRDPVAEALPAAPAPPDDLLPEERAYLEQQQSTQPQEFEREPETREQLPQVERGEVRLELEGPPMIDHRNRKAIKPASVDPEVQEIWDNIKKFSGQVWSVRVRKLSAEKRWANVGPKFVFNPAVDDPGTMEDSIAECFGPGSYLVEFHPPKKSGLDKLDYTFDVGQPPKTVASMTEEDIPADAAPLRDQMLSFAGVVPRSGGDGGSLLGIVSRQDVMAQSMSRELDRRFEDLKKDLTAKNDLADKMKADLETKFADMKREFATMTAALKPTNDKPSYISDLQGLATVISTINGPKITPKPEDTLLMLRAFKEITGSGEPQKQADVNTDILKLLLDQTKTKADPLDYLFKGIKLARGDMGVEDLKEGSEPEKPNPMLQAVMALLAGLGSGIGGGKLSAILQLLQGAQGAGGLGGLLPAPAAPAAIAPPVHREPLPQPPVRRGRILPFPTPPTPAQPIPLEPRTPVHPVRPAPVKQPVAQPPDYSVVGTHEDLRTNIAPVVEVDAGKIPAQYFQALDAVEGALRSPMSAAEIAMSVRQTIPPVMMAPFLRLSSQRFVEHAAKNLDSGRRVSLMELKDRVIEVFEELKKPAIT
jgi:hypothetical protein